MLMCWSYHRFIIGVSLEAEPGPVLVVSITQDRLVDQVCIYRLLVCQIIGQPEIGILTVNHSGKLEAHACIGLVFKDLSDLGPRLKPFGIQSRTPVGLLIPGRVGIIIHLSPHLVDPDKLNTHLAM